MTNREDIDKHYVEEAEKVEVGDFIELRYDCAPMIVDDEFAMHQPHYAWERVEVIGLLRAPAGNVVFEIKHADGTISTRPSVVRWRRASH